MTKNKIVLASGSLTEAEFQDFKSDISVTNVGGFVEIHHGPPVEGWVAVEVCDNELLHEGVAKSVLKESLMSNGGELNRLNWGKVIQIVE